MSEQALDLRGSIRIVRRHKILVATATMVGLAAGVVFTLLRPPMLASETLVVLPTSAARYITTQVVVADSDPVLTGAMRRLDRHTSLQALQSHVRVTSLSPTIISISANGKTAAEAEDTANAVANSYIAYLSSVKNSSIQMQAHVLEPAVSATGTSRHRRTAVYGLLGALAGLLVGAIIAVAIGRNPRRLRVRDDIADAIGVPVLASVPVARPSDAAGWMRFFRDYEPGAVQAWRLRSVLSQLGLTDVSLTGTRSSLAVLSLSCDRKALALGPQLAAYAASLGIPTALVVGPQQDLNTTAVLRAACDAPSALSMRSRLRVAVSDRQHTDRLPEAALTVVVAVVDDQDPHVAATMPATATVLGVSAGAVTAEQLARAAASAAADGRDIAGILVADPDPADQTTGRLPLVARPTHQKMPTRVAGVPTDSRRQPRMTRR